MNRIVSLIVCLFSLSAQSQTNTVYEGSIITEKGAWCWFADPRAIHYENKNRTVNSTYIGYIDTDGNIKATQHNFLTGKTDETLIRSYFQPDDHNNPTFLVLPDERVMVFYSRHTDEACFYYRISRKAGDITTLGEEKKLVTAHNTTYPSPFILANDPQHIYLCWRGINWHPTIARLSMPDENDNTGFDWGPKQIVRSTAARPYAKYFSNGKDKIYMAYTLGHPDNENPNGVFFNFINIAGADARQITLTDVKGALLSVINDETHDFNGLSDYRATNPDAVVNYDACRNWLWQVSKDTSDMPVIAMVQINDDKTSHDYCHVKWTGNQWQKTFLANGGGHFHQTPHLEMCYSGGMAIDDADTDVVYCSVPVEGANGKVYEIVKYTVNTGCGEVVSETVTQNSTKNNIRPFIIADSGNSPLRLLWMHGDYYDWIVSSSNPDGYPTAIHADFTIPRSDCIPKPLAGKFNIKGDFTVLLSLRMDINDYNGTIVQIGNLKYGINGETLKPYVEINNVRYNSSNSAGNSSAWRTASRGTNGRWYAPAKPEFLNIAFVYENDCFKTYINGLSDQNIKIKNLSFREIKTGDFKGVIENCTVYDRAVSQHTVTSLINKK